MYSHCTIKIIIFLLFQFKEIFQTRAICLENDVTKATDAWIAKIFEIDTKRAVALFDKLSSYTLKEAEYNSSQVLNNFGTKLFFQDVDFDVADLRDWSTSESGQRYRWDYLDETQSPQIYWKFPEDKIRITFEKFGITIKGTLCTKKNQPYIRFRTTFLFKNTTFVAINYGSSTKPDAMKTSHNFSYSDFRQEYYMYTPVKHHADSEADSTGDQSSLRSLFDASSGPISKTYEISPSYEKKKTHMIAHKTLNISPTEEQELTREFTTILPLMLRENFKHNRKFTQSLRKIFLAHNRPKNNILNKHPDFFNNSRKFHYLIPKISFLRFTLKRIVIGGLSNLEAFNVQKTSGMFTQTLLIRNVEGCMTLDYGFENETPLKMNFHVDCLFISKKQHTNCVYVQAKFYQVTRAKTNTSLTIRQAEVMINALESAIASSILPSMEVGKICELETPLENIKITNESDWTSIKESYQGWIPFNDGPDDSTITGVRFPFNVFQREK